MTPSHETIRVERADSTASGELSTALRLAGQRRRPLLVTFGEAQIGDDAVGVLLQTLAADPMYGFAIARVSCERGCCIAGVPTWGVGTSPWMPRDALAALAERDVLTETLAPCVMLSAAITGNFHALDAHFETVAAAMLHLMAQARRCGFRTVLANRIVITVASARCGTPVVSAMPAFSPWDHTRLGELVPDGARAWDQYGGAARQRVDRLFSVAPYAGNPRRPSLLVDVRNLGPVFNGTSMAILGTLNGLQALAPPWDVELLAQPAATAFHDLKARFTEWPVHRAIPDRSYTAAFRPSQPWHLQELLDLHAVSLVNVYEMLDTIAWDVVYPAPAHLDGIWRFMAANADGLFFISEFSRQRFLARFPATTTATAVTYLSFGYDDYIGGAASDGDDGYILVVGNGLDHKDVTQTVETLAAAFPYSQIVALGLRHSLFSRVRSVESGAIPEVEIQKLYARAAHVVFPSFYEGFGFPILTALGYRRTVLARRSALLSEVAAGCSPRGQLIGFETREELVRLLGRLRHGDTVATETLGAAGADRPTTWRDVAAGVMAHIEALVANPSQSRWRAREELLPQLIAHRG